MTLPAGQGNPLRPSPSQAARLAAQARQPPAPPTDVSDEARHIRAENSHLARWEKLLEREVVGRNSYIDVEKAFNLLLKLSSNILESPSESKPRTIKATSKVLRSTLLDLPNDAGQACLVALGFKRKVVAFEEVWTFSDEDIGSEDKGRLTGLEALAIAKGVLEKKEGEVRERSKRAQVVAMSKKEEDEQIRKEALAAIEHDRLVVKARANREREAAYRRQQAAAQADAAVASPGASRSQRGPIEGEE